MSEKLKPCPFCGSDVYLERKPMWRGSHGYQGCYEYIIKCPDDSCGCRIRLDKNTTIYHDDVEAMNYVITKWNKRAQEQEMK